MTTNSSSTARFDQAARDWDTRPTSQQLAVVPQRLLARVPLHAHDAVLDFGAGTGLLATAIAPQVAAVTALDTSAGMLQVLAEKHFANIRTLCQDIFAGLPQRFDLIVSCMAIHHVADVAGLFQAFAKAGQPGARLALVDLYAEDGSFHGDNAAKGVQHFGFAPEQMQQWAQQAGFRQIHFEEIAQVERPNGRCYPLFLMTAALQAPEP